MINFFLKTESDAHRPFIRYGYFKFANQSRVKLVLTRPHEAESAAPQLFLRLRDFVVYDNVMHIFWSENASIEKGTG